MSFNLDSLFNTLVEGSKYHKFEPLWCWTIPPHTENRYDPSKFHINMWNEWTGELCNEHRH